MKVFHLSIVLRMVLIASGLFFVWRRGRFSENSGGDSRKMFLKQEKKYCIYIYRIWYFKKTAHCSERVHNTFGGMRD